MRSSIGTVADEGGIVMIAQSALTALTAQVPPAARRAARPLDREQVRHRQLEWEEADESGGWRLLATITLTALAMLFVVEWCIATFDVAAFV
jgi:hypothetical protein